MVIRRVGQRADDRPEAAAFGQERQVLAELQAGGGRGNRLEFAADARGSGRLEIKAIQLGEAAGEEDVNTGLGPGRACFRGGTQRLNVVHAKAEQADRTRLKRSTSRENRVLDGWERRHGVTPAWGE